MSLDTSKAVYCTDFPLICGKLVVEGAPIVIGHPPLQLSQREYEIYAFRIKWVIIVVKPKEWPYPLTLLGTSHSMTAGIFSCLGATPCGIIH